MQDANDALSMRSPMWDALIAGRPAFSDATFAEFLSHSSNALRGIGMPGAMPLDEYTARFADWVERYQTSVSADELRALPEPCVGRPTIVEHGGYRASVPYIKNFALYVLVRDLVARHIGSRDLDFLEIGAGYGGMAQVLLQSGVAGRLAVVDLPEMLAYSRAYLEAVFPGRTGLAFHPPEGVSGLSGPYDVIVNVASFGEMPLPVARGYIAECERLLAANGVLISHNSVGRTPGGATRYSDYGYDRLGLLDVLPQPNIAGAFHDQHLVVVLGRHGAPFDAAILDRLGAMAALGLHEHVTQLARDAVAGRDATPSMFDGGNDGPASRYVASARALAEDGRIDSSGLRAYLDCAGSPLATCFAARLLGLQAPERVPAYLWRDVAGKSHAVIRARFQKALAQAAR